MLKRLYMTEETQKVCKHITDYTLSLATADQTHSVSSFRKKTTATAAKKSGSVLYITCCNSEEADSTLAVTTV